MQVKKYDIVLSKRGYKRKDIHLVYDLCYFSRNLPTKHKTTIRQKAIYVTLDRRYKISYKDIKIVSIIFDEDENDV